MVFPGFHRDTIREIAVSPYHNNLVVSGGFDCNVFVTDIARLYQDIQKSERKSENSLYPCRDVVGSVSWHPQQASVASCTTDVGVFHMFDVRTELRQPALVHDTMHAELYCHVYSGEHELLLGFGDGTLQVFDWRMKKLYVLLSSILSHLVSYLFRHLFVTFCVI